MNPRIFLRAAHEGATTRLAMWAAGILCLALAAAPARAADDRFDRASYDGRGGFAPVSDAVYRKECGACHFTYLPGLLPARSWRLVMDRLDRHFGERIELDAEIAGRLRAYLDDNAADKVADKGPAVLLERLGETDTPDRITRIPIMIRNHVVVREVIKVNTRVAARTITNCDACHQRADEGSFALRDLLVPGLSKVVRPGGQF
jgi:hypothetical protein